jgi:hypothetical protein
MRQTLTGGRVFGGCRIARKGTLYSCCCVRCGGTATLRTDVAWLRVGAWGGLPFLHHLRTSLTFETTISLTLEEE